MKKSLAAALTLFIIFSSHAQKVQKYYDWQWNECEPEMARFFSVGTQTDSGWKRTDYFLETKKAQMSGLYTDSSCKIRNGWFRYYYVNEKLSSCGRYVNNEREEIWLRFHNNGMMSDSAVFESGRIVGTSIGWHSNGSMADSAVYTNNGMGLHYHWFSNGNPSMGGATINNQQQGKWQYYHRNGQLASLEQYDKGALLSKTYYDESGNQLPDTSNVDKSVEFKGGSQGWKKYMENNLTWPSKAKLVNTHLVTVVIIALIDEDGKVADAWVDVPFNPLFDDEALRVVKKSPKWNPSISHNRRVQRYLKQPVSFMQAD